MLEKIVGIHVAPASLNTPVRSITMRQTLLVVLFALPLVAGCVNAKPATDTGDAVVSTPTSPSTPTTTTPTTPTTTTDTTTSIAFNPDAKATLQTDCLQCHGTTRADRGYRVTTYAQTMTAVRAGNASSLLIQVTRSGGSMYRYWSGSTAARAAKAEQIRSWIVNYNAQENR